MKKNEYPTITTLGLWHLGCVYTACLAQLGFNILGYDENNTVINNLNKGIPPILEPELTETIKKHLRRNLFFSSSLKESVKNKDYIFITHDLLVDNFDGVRMEIIEKTFSNISKYISPDTIVVISSQVPLGTSRKLVNLLKKNIKDPKVIYFPENLRLGNAFRTFLEPDRIILGSDNKQALEQFKKDFKFNCQFITMSLESAEMSKHALNAYLATCISFSSELSDLSEKTGVSMTDVVKALKTDKRISPFAPINPGLGFAGGTLGRDIQSLRKIAKRKKYETKLLNAVYVVNQYRLPHLYSKIYSICPNLKGRQVGILGLTYTPKTDTLRRSMSLELASLLKKKGCQIKAIDPAIKKQIPTFSYIKVCLSQDSFFKDLDLAILMTEWPQFREIKISKISSLMHQKIILDTKNFLNPNLYKINGFIYMGIGGA